MDVQACVLFMASELAIKLFNASVLFLPSDDVPRPTIIHFQISLCHLKVRVITNQSKTNESRTRRVGNFFQIIVNFFREKLFDRDSKW